MSNTNKPSGTGIKVKACLFAAGAVVTGALALLAVAVLKD